MNGNYRPKYKICVSGAAETNHCGEKALQDALEMGREIARRNMVLVTGATTGVPYWAAKGAKEAGGTVIGLSPAASEAAHIKTYRLPVDYHDLIIYTGFEYSGRNLLLIRASDAIISLCGRMGTLNEFTVAFEDQKPIGVLEGEWESDDLIKEMVTRSHRGPGKIVYSKTPGELLDRILALVEKEKNNNH